MNSLLQTAGCSSADGSFEQRLEESVRPRSPLPPVAGEALRPSRVDGLARRLVEGVLVAPDVAGEQGGHSNGAAVGSCGARRTAPMGNRRGVEWWAGDLIPRLRGAAAFR